MVGGTVGAWKGGTHLSGRESIQVRLSVDVIFDRRMIISVCWQVGGRGGGLSAFCWANSTLKRVSI